MFFHIFCSRLETNSYVANQLWLQSNADNDTKEKNVTASNPTVQKVIFFAVAFGPAAGVAVVGLPVLIVTESVRDAVMLFVLGYIFGTIPALTGAILFIIVRRALGSGYLVAAMCGWISTFSAFSLLSNRYDPWTMIFAAFSGALPALALRALARRSFQ